VFNRKKVEEMAEKLDSKSYYRWLVERDKKRVSKLKFLTFEGVKKLVNLLLHLTGIHRLEEENTILIDGKGYTIYRCKVCNYKCTDLALKREVVKFGLGYLVIIGTWISLYLLLQPFPEVLSFILALISSLHTFAGVIFLLDNASALRIS